MIAGLLTSSIKAISASKQKSKKVDRQKLLPGGYQRQNFKPGEGYATGGVWKDKNSIIVRPKTSISSGIKVINYKVESGDNGSGRGGALLYESLSKRLDALVKNTDTLTQIAKDQYKDEVEDDRASSLNVQRIAKKTKEEKAEAKAEKKLERNEFGLRKPKLNMFDGLFSTLQKLIFGTAVMELLRFFSDPKKAAPVLKFLQDNFVGLFVGTMAIVGTIAASSLLGLGGLLTIGLPLFFKLAGLLTSVLLSPLGLVALAGFGLYKLTDFIRKDVRGKRNRKLAASLIEKGLTPQEAIVRTEKRLKEEESKFFKDKYKINLIREDLEFLRSLLPKPSKTSPKPSAEKVPERIPQLPPTGTVHGQEYGASRDGGARKHAGTDFDIGPNDTFYSQIGGEVTNIGYDPNGYGNYVDIYNADLDKTERIAEGKTILVSKGDMIIPGQAVVQGETETGVIHYEIRQGKKTTFGFFGTENPIEFLESQRVKDVVKSVSSSASYDQESSPTIVPIIQPPPQLPSGGGGSAPSISNYNEQNQLNNYYRNQILGSLYRQ